MDQATAPVFNELSALETVGGDASFLVTILEIFLDTTPEAMASIAEAVEAGDAHRTDRAAHKLKGEVAAIGAEAAFAAAKQLNESARIGHVDAFADGWAELQHQMALLVPVLRQYCVDNA